MNSRNEKISSSNSQQYNGIFSKLFSGFGRKPKKSKQKDILKTRNPSDSISDSAQKCNQNESSNNNYKRSYNNVFNFVNDSVKKDYDSSPNDNSFNKSSLYKHKKIPSMFELNFNDSEKINVDNNLACKNSQNAQFSYQMETQH